MNMIRQKKYELARNSSRKLERWIFVENLRDEGFWLKQSLKEYFSRFHFKFSPNDDIRGKSSKAKNSHLLPSCSLIYIHSMSPDIFSSSLYFWRARVKVNVIFLCRDIKIISNTFMDISMYFPFALPFHAVSILRGVLRAKVWENILYRGCCLFISKYLLIFMRFSLLLSQRHIYHPPI